MSGDRRAHRAKARQRRERVESERAPVVYCPRTGLRVGRKRLRIGSRFECRRCGIEHIVVPKGLTVDQYLERERRAEAERKAVYAKLGTDYARPEDAPSAGE